MTLQQLRKEFIDSLSAYYDSNEVHSFFYMLSEHLLGYRRVDVALKLQESITETVSDRMQQAIIALQQYHPIQYIMGSTSFYGMSFHVTPSVLIPRPETEELIAWIVAEIQAENQQQSPLRILDIGTGSGCIAITLAKQLPNAIVHAIDISEDALAVASANAAENQVQVQWIQADILKTKALADQYDIIVSNPPYVREQEKEEMQANVLENEPHLALFVSDHDPLIFYKKITAIATAYLKEQGKLYFEINQYLGAETVAMIEAHGLGDVILKKDINTNDRMIRAVALPVSYE